MLCLVANVWPSTPERSALLMRNDLKILQAEAVGAIAFVAPVIDPSIPRLSHKKLGSLSLHLVKPHFTSSSWKWGAHGIHKVSQIISTVGVPSSKKLQVAGPVPALLVMVICTWNLSFSCRLGTYSYPKVPTKHRTLGTKRLANRGTVVTCIWCCHIHGARPQQLMKPPNMLKTGYSQLKKHGKLWNGHALL